MSAKPKEESLELLGALTEAYTTHADGLCYRECDQLRMAIRRLGTGEKLLIPIEDPETLLLDPLGPLLP